MRSVIDWLSEFYAPKRNRYLRLNEAERGRLGIRVMVFFLVVVAFFAFFAIWHWLRLPDTYPVD